MKNEKEKNRKWKIKNKESSIFNAKIDSLPDDALIEIIKFIPLAQWPHLEKVSRRFRRLTHEAWLSLKKIQLS